MNLHKKHYIILGIWFVINLLQSIFTGLHSDESYYWMYSQNLDWGYFDHPPMAALFIHAGHAFLPGELGVRLFFLLISTMTLGFILNELNEQDDLFFLSVFVFAFPLIHTHIAGFLAIPDIPLLFFTVLFLLLYRKFLLKPGLRLSVLLALLLAAMIYSKYHAFLLIGFTLLSNLKLLRNKYFWIIAGLTLLLLIPHIWWQVENGFPTFRYHLVERAKPFRLKHITDYLLNQLLMAGPLTGILVFWKLSKIKITNDFNRALVFNVVGFYTIFFLLSFKNRIEAHWTAAIIPMLMLLTYPLIKKDPAIKRWFIRLALPVILLMMLYRVYLAVDAIPNIGQTKITFYQREASALEIKKMAEGRKVGFYNNYAAASNYIFYAGEPAVHLSTPDYRFCQYDLWDDEKYAFGEPVFAIQPRHMNPPNLTRMVTGEMKGHMIIGEFQPLTGLEISDYKAELKNGNLFFDVTLHNTTQNIIHTSHSSEPVIAIMQNSREVASFPLSLSNTETISPEEQATLSFAVKSSMLDPNAAFIFFTRTKENIRGEILAVHPH